MKKVMLLSTEMNWWGVARMPEVLQREGFRVSALCPRDALLARSNNIDSLFLFWSPLSLFLVIFLIRAFRKERPLLIIPGDDRAASCLQLFVSSNSIMRYLIPQDLRQVIVRSCGKECKFLTISDKKLLQETASSLDIRTPSNNSVSDFESCRTVADNLGYPVVLKLDQGFGGQEVRICQSVDKLNKAFIELNKERKVSFGDMIKYELKRFFMVNWERPGTGISLQIFVSGRPAYFSFFAREGELSGGITALTVENHPEKTGPGSVIKIIDHPEIEEAVQKIINYTGFTGFGCVDFVLDNNNHAFLLEFNPRVTLISFLGKELGTDMCGVMKCHIENSNDTSRYINLPAKHEMVSLYPLELLRDPASQYLKTTYHAVPSEESGLQIL